MNRIRIILGIAKRAGECLAGRRCVAIPCGGLFAVIATVLVVGIGKRRPIFLVLVPICCFERGIARASIHGDRRSVPAGDHVIDEASDLIPTSYS